MATKRATYTPEFELRAVPTATEQKVSVAEPARPLNVHEGRLYEWKKAHLKDGDAAFPESGHPTPAGEELRRLRAGLKRLGMERNILKKAAAFFAALTK